MTPLRAHSSCVIGCAVEGAQRPRRVGEIAREMLAGDIAVVDRLDRAAVIFLDAAALLDPFDAGALEALLDVDRGVVVGIDAGRIVDPHRLLAGTLRQRNLAQRHAQIRRRFGRRIDLARAGNRAGGDLRRGEIGFGERLIHRVRSFACRSRERSGMRRMRLGRDLARSFRPFAGMTRIRFKGFFSARCPGTPRNALNIGRWRGVSTRCHSILPRGSGEGDRA